MSNAFLAPDSWLGWTLPDYVSLLFAGVIAAVLWRRTLRPPKWLEKLAAKRYHCAAIVFALPIILRCSLLRSHPAPVPSGADDFGYLLAADTVRHFRLANPPNGLPEFFEQIFVLQRPAYAAIFPLGQAFVLVLGWTGVLLSAGAFCAALYWMLRGWVSPLWALLGAVLAGLQFGPLCYWMNCYWGGYVSATGGCLVFGSVARRGKTAAALLGIGLALQVLTRQYEFLLLLAAVLLFFPARLRPITAACFVPALLLIGLQNRAITGSWTTLPYVLYRYQYGVPATFTWQRNPLPHAGLNAEQELDYRTEVAVHGGRDSIARFAERLWLRIRFYRFFLYAPLYVAVLWFLIRVRAWWLIAAVAIFVLGSNFYPYFYPHYIAAVACVFVLAAIWGLQRMRPAIAAAILVASLSEFAYSFATHRGSWDFINGVDPQGRATIAKRLAAAPGKQMVFVHYSSDHGLSEWIHNAADIDASRVVFVHDLGAAKNAEILEEYPKRRPWLLKPDESPPVLLPYPKQESVFEDVQ